MTRSDIFKYRLLEMIPGLCVWMTFVLMLVLSFARPLWAIYFILVFDLYWLLKIFYLLVYLFVSYHHFDRDQKIHWFEELEKQFPNYRNKFHVVFLPAATEPFEVIEPTFKGIEKCHYPNDRMIVVFAVEERFRERLEPTVKKIQQAFSKTFYQLFVVWHPAGVPGEMAGKGSNLACAAKDVKAFIDQEKINYHDVIVSTFDVDTVVHPDYFAYLTVKYLSHPNPERASFQPVPMFNNNIWDAPMIMRVASFGTTFWLMTEQLRPERLFTFSSHSMSFQALADVGFWQSDIVTEDSRIFLQCFFRYDGQYEVVPLFIPVSMDAVVGDTWWDSLKNLYKQQRRWMWGVEHVPYMLWFFRRSKIPFYKKIRYLWNQGEGVYSMATAPIVIFVLGRLPLWVSSWKGDLEESIIVQNTPFILENLMMVAMVGLLVSAILGLTLLPPRPKKHHQVKYLVMLLQWILLPVSMIVFGSFPAIEAQTRLMLGKYLGFFISPKSRTSSSQT